MAWIPTPKIFEICQIFVDADFRTRQDFIRGEVVSERDYLSRFLTLAAYPRISHGEKHKGIYAVSCTTGSVERRHGIDAVFVFKYQSEIKIAVCECKIEKPNFDDGRFKTQLSRQRRLLRSNPGIIVFEMFFHKGFRFPFQPHLSSISTLNQLDEFLIVRHSGVAIDRWAITDLEDLFNYLSSRWPFPGDIGSILYMILQCYLGEPISLFSRPQESYGSTTTYSRDNKFTDQTRNLVNIIISGENNYYRQVQEYCTANKLDAICCIDFDQL